MSIATHETTTLKRFHIPVNPEYDWEQSPEQQGTDYANPVELNNKLIQHANEQIRITDYLVAKQRELARLRVDIKTADHKYAQLRNQLLRQFPPGASDRKTNVIVDAYVERVAWESGRGEEYGVLVQDRLELEARETVLEAEIESGKQVYFMLKEVGSMIQTHLSYRKHEYIVQSR